MSNGTSSPQVDPLFAAITLFFGPVLGPYLLIGFVAAMGAMLALSRTPTDSKKSGVLFILRMVFIALIFTIPMSIIIGDHAGLSSTILVMPIAAVIGVVGNGWWPLLDSAMTALSGFISRFTGAPK
jgi:hypothetical protein